MAGIPKYNITPCCPDLGTQVQQFHIPDGPVPNGVYVYNGPNITVNGISFQINQCYTIEQDSSDFSILPDAPSYNDFSIVNDCNDGQCIACAPALPHAFNVYACCDSADVVTLNIDAAINTTNGVYSYDGSIPFTVGGFIFEPGDCYKIEYIGDSIAGAGPSLLDFLYQGPSCTLTENCPSCPITEQYLAFTSCCDKSVVYLRPHSTSTYTEGVYEYLGTPVSGLENICYSLIIKNIGEPPIQDIIAYNALQEAPAFVENVTFDTKSNTNTNCNNYKLQCPSCKKTCYKLYNCDGVTINTTSNLAAYVGQFIAIYDNSGPIAGTWFVTVNSGNCNNAIEDIQVDDVPVLPCDCRCFEIVGTIKTLQYLNCDNEIIKDATITKFCSRIYPFVTGTPGQYSVIEGDICIDGLCPEKCYKLTNCDTNEVIYSTLQTLSQYVNTSSVVTLLGYEGCWEVDESTATSCDCITVTIEDRSGINEYTATLIAPYNGWNRWTFVIGSDNYYIWNASVNPSTNWTISKDSSGPIPGPTYAESKFNGECPETISDGTVTGWVIQEVPWINVQTEKCPGPCECPVDITIIQEFSSCETCEPVIAYKLQNCEKIYEVQYTTQDLSAYVNQVVETDCGCFTVQQINYIPPSETLIVIENGFKTCNDCLSTFYRLVDCSGESGDIVTRTNLADYVGQVIKIENCDTCWEVSTTRTFTELSNVVVVNSYKDCPECGVDLPCVCSKLTNLTSTEQLIEYIDCENETQEIILQPGETSQKICLKKWILDTPQPLPPNELLYPEYFGNCQNGVCPQPVFKNNRTVKPGYNTPACTPDKYDEITCRFADIMYKVVLEKRYGITNCCPDEDDKWLIEKELIDMQALKDPNYNCPECMCSCNLGNSCSICKCKK